MVEFTNNSLGQEDGDKLKDKMKRYMEDFTLFLENSNKAFDSLGKEVEMNREQRETKEFLDKFDKNLKAEWTQTQDYEDLTTTLLGYGADLPARDIRKIIHTPKNDFIICAKLFTVMYEIKDKDGKQIVATRNIDSTTIERESKQLLLSAGLSEEEIQRGDFSNSLSIGPIDSMQFFSWLFMSEEGQKFINGPFETLEDYIVWNLVKEHKGQYTKPNNLIDKTPWYSKQNI